VTGEDTGAGPLHAAVLSPIAGLAQDSPLRRLPADLKDNHYSDTVSAAAEIMGPDIALGNQRRTLGATAGYPGDSRIYIG
jgi:hypothetical protein